MRRMRTMKNNGMLVILSGPAGSGKDTVIAELFKSDIDITKSVSMTTRKPRDSEIDGIDYLFVSEEDFLDAVENGELLEYARYGVNYYGTPKGPVDKWLEDGHIVILKIDVQGAGNIKKMYPDAVSIFIMPPSMEILETRLRNRGSEEEDDVLRRGEHVHELVVLVDHADVVVEGVLRRADDDFLIVNENFALVWEINTREHVHQGGLSRAVFAQKRKYLASVYIEPNLVVSFYRAE